MAAAASSAGAAITSMMTLMRKQSFRADLTPLVDYTQDDSTSDNLEWMNRSAIRFIFRLIGFLSFVSTCMNTPRTFESYPSFRYVTFLIDIICVIVLTFEAAAKIKTRGFIIGDGAYLKERWNHFDAIMIINVYLSIVLQVRTISSHFH